jgi:hypothetical protein
MHGTVAKTKIMYHVLKGFCSLVSIFYYIIMGALLQCMNYQ